MKELQQLNKLVELIKHITKDKQVLQVRFIDNEVQVGLCDRQSGQFTILSSRGNVTPLDGLCEAIELMHEEFDGRAALCIRQLCDTRQHVTNKLAEIDGELAFYEEMSK